MSNNQGISLFQLHLQQIEQTPVFQQLRTLYTDHLIVKDDYTLYVYLYSPVLRDTTIVCTPKQIQIFKEQRQHTTDYIYSWSGHINEFNGERFATTLPEYLALRDTGDYLRGLLTYLEDQEASYSYLTESAFVRNGKPPIGQYQFLQQRIEQMTADIQQYYGFRTHWTALPYFHILHWQDGIAGEVYVLTPEAPMYLRFNFSNMTALFYCEVEGVQEKYPLLMRVTQSLLKEQSYGKVLRVLLQEEAARLDS